MRERLAKLTSNLLNPFLVSFVVIILLSLKATDTVSEAVKWASISLAVSVVPVFVVVASLAKLGRLDGIFINPRRQRYRIYILATALGAAGLGIMWFCEAPELLTATFAAGLAAIIVFMGINFFWKISLHTAFMAASVTVLVSVYGAVAAWTIVLLPPVAWARIEMKQHSPWQVATGAMLAVVIVAVVFWGFGLVG